MIDLIQPITVQQAYDKITHERWRASWNWRWRMIDDEDASISPLWSLRQTLDPPEEEQEVAAPYLKTESDREKLLHTLFDLVANM